MGKRKFLCQIVLFMVCMLLVSAWAFLSSVSPALAAGSVTVTTPSGPVAGLLSEGISVYKGIPYAKPPIGDLRFAPPEDVVPWTTTLDCTNFGPIAVQARESPGLSMSEDCLTLNVWTPATPGSGDKLPVYVFIHGGAFSQGSGAEPMYDGTNFAKRGIVTITINYRLNALGFLATQETYDKYGTTGNWGYLDQVKALEWIRDNVSAFGGDPSRVTIGGESAGSYAVSALIMSPLAKGLFQGAIMESGSNLQVAGNSYYAKAGLKRSIEVCNMLSTIFGATDDAAGLAKLRTVDANALAQMCPLEINFIKTPAFFMLPVYDGKMNPKNPLDTLKAGDFNKVRLLFGYNADEGSLFIQEGVTEPQYKALANRTCGYDRAKDVLARFPVDAQNSPTQRARQILAYGMFSTGMKVMGDALARAGLDVYAYHFDFVSEANKANGMGATHAAELPYVFDNLEAEGLSGAEHEALADEMHTRWANFIKNGNPNVGDPAPSSTLWPKYDANDPRMIFFDRAVTSGPMPGKEDLVFMQELLLGDDPYYAHETSQPTPPVTTSGSGGCIAGAMGVVAVLATGAVLFIRRNRI